MAVTIFADDGGAEFSSVSAAMFTAFRCFTDGCAATDGTPLQELLLQSGTLLDIYCSCKWSYTPYKWPYKWATAVITPKNGGAIRGPLYVFVCLVKGKYLMGCFFEHTAKQAPMASPKILG